jgi:hypothetical protein
MAQEYGPKIVTDGLVLCLDKYDLVSYVGEPTTNLAPTGMNSWSVNASGYSSYGTRTLRTEVYSNEIANIVDTDDNTRQYSWISGLSENTVYSFSNYYRKISGTPTFRYQLSWYTDATALISANWVQTAALGIADVSGWQRAMCTVTTPANTDKMIWWLQDGADYTGYTHEFEIKRPMMETNSHVTKFVNGSRSATDGWKDLSGNGNHADLTSLTYSATNIRNTPNNDFSFDGANDYVDTGNAFQSTFRNSFSVELWAKLDDGQPGTIDYIFGTANADESARLFMYIPRTDGSISFYFGVDSDEVTGTSSAILSDGQEIWRHFCLTIVSGGTATLYMDGVSRCTGDASGVTMSNWTSSDEVFIGTANDDGSPVGNAFDGDIAVTRIYQKALSSTEVLQNYNAQRSRFSV